MDCESFGRCLDNYESVTDEEKLEMTAHAAECESCGKDLDFMLSIINTTKSLPKIEPPADFMDTLSARIDIEERKKKLASRLAYRLRRNWRQYTAAAACLALVAVITANGKALIGRMDNNDGVIVDPIGVSDNVQPTSAPNAESAIEPAKQEADTGSADDMKTVNMADNTDNRSVGTAVENVPVRVSSLSGSESRTSAQRTVTVNETAQNDNHISNIDSFSQAENTADAVTDENLQIAMYSAEPEESVMTREAIPEGYSVSGREEIIIAKYEEPENEEDKETKKVIGKIKIAPEDAPDAMDLIMKYSHDVDGDLYTTDSANLTLMLSDLIKRGVSYANYTPEYEGNIKFQLVIG